MTLFRISRDVVKILYALCLMGASAWAIAAPTALDDAATVGENSTSQTINPLANDAPGSGTLTIVSASTNSNGTALIAGDGLTLQYTPATDFVGTEIIYYVVEDADDTATAIVTVTVTANAAPVVVDDTATVSEDGATITVDALANDSDPEAVTLSILSVTASAGATVSVVNDEIQYTPATNFNGTETLTYIVSDGVKTATGSVVVSVTPVNDAPTAQDNAFTVLEDADSALLDVLTNDIEVDTGDTLSITVVSTPDEGGSASISNGQIAYQPAANFNGTETFSYTISDGTVTDVATVTVTVTSVNDAPSAVDDSATVTEDTLDNQITVIGNDTDVDGDTLVVLAVNSPANGAASLVGNTVLYSPDPDFFGTDSLTYVLSDGAGGFDTGTVTITVQTFNNTPVATADAEEVDEDAAPTSFDVLANDSDADSGDTLSIISVTTPDNGGAATISSGQIVYEPASDFNGLESFDYTVSDGRLSSTATVSVTISPVNDAPVATDDSIAVAEDVTIAIPILTNDTDIEGDTLSVQSIGVDPAHGTALIVGNQIEYTPDADYNGSDSFSYFVYDGTDADIGEVTVLVTPVNDAPIAQDDTASVDEDASVTIDVLANDSDIEDDTLTIVSVTAPSDGGSATILNGQIVYQPLGDFNGTETFTYTASDGAGSATATVTLTVNSVNDIPIAVDDSFTVEEGSTGNSIDVLANDTDGDGDALSLEEDNVEAPENGELSVVNNVIVYTPNADFAGVEVLSYVVEDVNGDTDIGMLVITVANINDVPIVTDDIASVDEDASVTIDVLANDTDIEGDTLTIQSVTTPSNGGSATISGGQIVYEPLGDFNGTDSFTYTVSDGLGSTTGTVTVTVNAVNDDPVFVADATEIVIQDTESHEITVSTLTSNDSDADSDTLTIAAITNSTQGGVVSVQELSGVNVITYSPPSGYVGLDSLNYVVSDGNGGSALGTLTISVVNRNDAPTVANDTLAVTEDSDAIVIDVLSNDSDVDGDTFTIVSVSTPSGGGSAVISNNAITYQPATDFNGVETFTYTVSDGTLTSIGVVTVTVTSVNDLPTVVPDSMTVFKNADVTNIDVLANDSDSVEGDTLTISSVSTSGSGSVSISENQIFYQPATDFVGSETLTYVVSDGHGGSVSGLVAVQVIGSSGSCDATSLEISSIESDCSIGPQGLRTSIYAFGLCTASPTRPSNGTEYDLSNCSMLYESDAGQIVTFGEVGTSFAFTDFVEPALGTYAYGVIIFGSDLEVKGGIELQNETCVTSDLASNRVVCSSAYSLNSAEFAPTPLEYFFDESVLSYEFATDSVSLDLVDSSTRSLAVYDADSNIGTADRVFAIQQLTSPVTYADTTRVLDIGFKISTSVVLDTESPSGETGYADSAPFSMQFSVR